MKKKLLIGLCALGLIVANYSANKGTKERAPYKNIALMQANAGEIVCDQENNEECAITINGKPLKSKGYLRAFN